MALLKQHTAEVIKKFKQSELDTGSPEVQVALLTARISDLTEHFRQNKQDFHGRLGLVKMVNRRKKLLSYLKNKNFDRYVALIKELKLRK